MNTVRGVCTPMREPSRFYRCVDLSGTGKHYRRYQFSCPAGTAFDEGLSICNFLHAVLPCANQAKKAVISQVMSRGKDIRTRK